jgi:hypothetical protein
MRMMRQCNEDEDIDFVNDETENYHEIVSLE